MTSRTTRRWTLPRPTGWHLFVTLLILALASEYWDKDPATIGGVQLPWPRFLIACASLFFVIPHAGLRWRTLLRLPSSTAPLLVLWACCALSVLSALVAPGPSSVVQFVKTFAHFSIYVAFVVVLVRWMTWPRLMILIRAYYVLGIVAAGFAVAQWLHGSFGFAPGLTALRLQSAEFQVGEGLTTGFRAASFFGEPSWAARYYVHFIAVCLAYWASSRQWWHLAILALLLVAFYTANSLLGYVVLASFAALLLVQRVRRYEFRLPSRRTRLLIGVALYGCALTFLLAGTTPRVPDLVERSVRRVELIFRGAGAVGNRIDGVQAGFEVWKLAPIAGVGLGNIDLYIVPFYKDPEWVLRSRHSADSVFVQVAAETGIVGLLAFLWFWANLVWYRRARSTGDIAPHVATTRALVRFLQLDLLAQAVGMLNSSDYLNPHLWTVVAIVLSAKLLLQNQSRAAQPANARPAPVKPLVPVYAP